MDPRKKFRRMVSLKKKRFQDGDFDLDLAYITDRIIAFGFPAEGREALFRNPMPECQRFFEAKHKDHYYIYNLCIEKDRQYKEKKFHNRVGKYQWHDHNAPPLELIPAFCEHAGNWLDEDPENVVAVHCKAGKGRTGVLITCLLLYLKMYDDADEAMDFYGKQRTHNGKGVTIPSQRRFIRHYSSILANGMPDKAPVAFLKELRIEHLSTFDNTDFAIGIECNMMPLHRVQKGDAGYPASKSGDLLQIEFNCLPLTANTKIIVYDPKKNTPICWFWFHCAFVGERLHLLKPQIDGAVGDREHLVFPENFSITVTFDTAEADLLAADEEKGKKSKKSKKVDRKKKGKGEPEGEKASKSKRSKRSKDQKEEKEEKAQAKKEESEKEEASEKEEESEKEASEAKEEEKEEKKKEEKKAKKNKKSGKKKEEEEEKEASEEVKEASGSEAQEEEKKEKKKSKKSSKAKRSK